jgi:hypothetical protein
MNRAILGLFVLAAAAPAQWQRVADLPQARYSGALVNVGEKLYYIGGSAVGGVKTRTTYVYDVAADSWSVGESLATARHRFGAVECRGKIYVFGGWGDGGTLLKSCEVYDTLSGHWTAIETLPSGRASVFAGSRLTTPGYVYCFGGWTGTQSLDQALQYDVGTGHWTARAPMPTARCEGASANSSGYLFCIGGTPDGAELLGTNECYVAHGDTWVPLSDMPTPRMACAGAAWDNVAVLGGIVSPGSTTRRHEYYDWGHDIWRTGDSLPEPLRYLAATSAFTWPDGWLFVAGGTDSAGQTSNRVYRTYFPVGVAEPSLPAELRQVSARVVRSGARIPVPVGATGRELVSIDGRLVERCAGGRIAVVPDLAPGVYVARWNGSEAVTRMVIVGR